MAQRIVFGYAAAEGRARNRRVMTELADRLGALSDLDVIAEPRASYEDLAQAIHHDEIDLAWLSPIPLISLARNRRVIPLVSLHRGKLLHYRCALIARAGSHMSTYEEMRGKRVAWVDRLSAAGYVLPRIKLAGHGIGPKQLASEGFFGSHEGVVRAIASGRADFGATFAQTEDNGDITGPWSATDGLARSVRVMKTFGELPPDAIAARFDLEASVRTRLGTTLRGMTKRSDDRVLARAAFGVDKFDTPQRAAYEALATFVYRAHERGLLQSDGAKDSVILNAAATALFRPPDDDTLETAAAEVLDD